MIITLVPLWIAIILAIVAVGRRERRGAAWRMAFTGIGAAGAALSVGAFIDAYFARELFSGAVPYDAGSNWLFDVYRNSGVRASHVGIVGAAAVLIESTILALLVRGPLVGRNRIGSILTAIAAAIAAVIAQVSVMRAGVDARSLLMPQITDPSLATRLEVLLSIALVTGAVGCLLSIALYVFVISSGVEGSRRGGRRADRAARPPSSLDS